MNMVKVKTAELEGAPLDWAVAKAAGWDFSKEFYRIMAQGYRPSTDWSQGGPLIEKYKLEIVQAGHGFACVKSWVFSCYDVDELHPEGSTHLIAAMRAIVAAKLGDEVEVPGELVG